MVLYNFYPYYTITTSMSSKAGWQKGCHCTQKSFWYKFFNSIENSHMAKSNRKSSIPHSTSKNKTAKEIVKRHLSNQHDKITDDDFKNLKIDLSIPKDRAHEPLPIKEGKERPKDVEKDNTITIPWDVISE